MKEPINPQLKQWMAKHNITLLALAEQLGMSISGARSLLVRETIPTFRHSQLVRLGFPAHLLSKPMDIPPGRKLKTPSFPGLATA